MYIVNSVFLRENESWGFLFYHLPLLKLLWNFFQKKYLWERFIMKILSRLKLFFQFAKAVVWKVNTSDHQPNGFLSYQNSSVRLCQIYLYIYFFIRTGNWAFLLCCLLHDSSASLCREEKFFSPHSSLPFVWLYKRPFHTRISLCFLIPQISPNPNALQDKLNKRREQILFSQAFQHPIYCLPHHHPHPVASSAAHSIFASSLICVS